MDVDQLKGGDANAAAGPVEEPMGEAPSEAGGQPDLGALLGGGAPPEAGASPGMPPAEQGAPDMGGAPPTDEGMGAPDMGGEPPMGRGGDFFTQNLNSGLWDDLDQQDDTDIILDAAKEVKDPVLKQQLLAIVYQALEAQAQPPAPPMDIPPAPPSDGDSSPEEILAALGIDAPPADGEMPPEALMRSEGIQKDANVADDINKPLALSDDDKEKEEPGVNDGKEKGDGEIKDEELPVVTEVQIEAVPEGCDDIDSPCEQNEENELESIVEDALNTARARIIEEFKTKHAAMECSGEVKKSMPKFLWPKSYKKLTNEDKCHLFAKSFRVYSDDEQDAVVNLMDRLVGAEKTDSIFKSEGVDLGAIYEDGKSSKGDDNTATGAFNGSAAGADTKNAVNPVFGKKLKQNVQTSETAQCSDDETVECCDDKVIAKSIEPIDRSAIKKSQSAPKGMDPGKIVANHSGNGMISISEMMAQRRH